MIGHFWQLLTRRKVDSPHALSTGEPPWAAELKELNQKAARAQMRVSVQLESVERKTEAGFTDLRSMVDRLSAALLAPQDPRNRIWSELLDAADALAAAIETTAIDSTPELRTGLQAVAARLDGALSHAGFAREREAVLGRPPDGARFRIVGAHPDPSLPEGSASRVLRSAVTHLGVLIREGEILTNRSFS